MFEDDQFILVYTTFETQDDAEAVGRALVEQRLAACVNILSGMTSIYRWNDAIERASEVVMIIKTRHDLEGPVLAATQKLHPYDTPALIVLPVLACSSAFGAWITAQTS